MRGVHSFCSTPFTAVFLFFKSMFVCFGGSLGRRKVSYRDWSSVFLLAMYINGSWYNFLPSCISLSHQAINRLCLIWLDQPITQSDLTSWQMADRRHGCNKNRDFLLRPLLLKKVKDYREETKCSCIQIYFFSARMTFTEESQNTSPKWSKWIWMYSLNVCIQVLLWEHSSLLKGV